MTQAALLEALDPTKLDDLLSELGERNTVRVVKYEAARPKRFAPAIRRKVLDEQGAPKLLTPALVRLDELRMSFGLAPRYLREALRLGGGELVAVTPNLRTNVGIDYAADSLGKSASRPAVAEYMAVSENATAPAAGDTTLAGEITTGGLARALATYAHTVGATNFTMSKTYTATVAFSAVQKAGLFNASTGGTMYVENTFTATALAVNDQLVLTWTLNV